MTLDLLRAVVQGGRDRADFHRPAAPGGDLADVAGQGTAGDYLDGRGVRG
jgi:hypothetical protein